MTKSPSKPWLPRLLCAGVLASSLLTVGCQMNVGGQTLPSPYYLTDDVQYFPPGPEFKLSREAAAMKEYQAELELQRSQQRP